VNYYPGDDFTRWGIEMVYPPDTLCEFIPPGSQIDSSPNIMGHSISRYRQQ